MLSYIIVFVEALNAVAAQLLLKRGVETLGNVDFSVNGFWFIFLQIFKNVYLFSGLFLLGVSLLLWIWVISKIQLHLLYPAAVSLQLVLLVIGSWLWFNETLVPSQIIGILVIIAGIFLLSVGGVNSAA